MARNETYKFFNTDTDALVAELTADLEQRIGTTVRPDSPEMLILRWTAAALTQGRVLSNFAANQNLPSRATGENLDALAELFYTASRATAAPAWCTVRFYLSTVRGTAVLIPAGTRVTDDAQTLYWETTEDGYVSAGEQYVDLPVRCMTAGTAGNGWSAGQIRKLVDLYDYQGGVESITGSDGGADEQSDDELYEAMIASMVAPSTAGSVGGYIYHAKAVSTQIYDVSVRSPSPGEIRICALMDDGAPASETMKAKILTAVSADDVRPLADHVETEEPEIVPYDIDLTYWIPTGTTDAASIVAAVEKAVEKYIAWQSGAFGRDIDPSWLIAMVMGTGVTRVAVTAPVHIAVSGGDSDGPPAIAKVGSIDLKNGGTEDAR